MRLLLVEDSLTVRTYLERILRSAPDIELLPSAVDGATGVARVLEHKPDVVLMDLELPVLSGLDAIKEIMATSPCPIVVLSGILDKTDIDRTLESFRLGAVEVVKKPQGISAGDQKEFAERLLRILRVMSKARVLRRKTSPSELRPFGSRPELLSREVRKPRVVLIGASTGGPLVLRRILEGIGHPYPLPIVICQHIVPGFEQGLALWLAESGHKVWVAETGAFLEPGRVFLSPSDQHLVLDGFRISLVPKVPGRVSPSVDLLFESAARTLGDACIALLLTGMGEDGKNGMIALHQQRALTITQSADSCVVDGMPGAARRVGASELDLSPSRMVDILRGAVS